MDAYLLYLKTSMSDVKNRDVLFLKLEKLIQQAFHTSERVNIIPQAYSDIPDGYDIFLNINTTSRLELDQRQEFTDGIREALFEDQGNNFRILIKFDPQFTPKPNELDYKKRAENFSAVKPEYAFDRVILPDSTKRRIDEALNTFKYKKKVFDEWGLREIEPHPSAALSFYGPSGTGKTMAAEAIAHKLGKKILRVSYADVESKFHGEGPKMVKAIFYAAERDDAVLFIDESDSLLSKRLTNVSSGSDQAINSMRSQLLISLERFEGIVIFATNLVVNYDQAFLTRLISVEFTLPDEQARRRIWKVHLKPDGSNSKLNIPLSDDVDIDELAAKYNFCGREIKKAVISACISVAINQIPFVCQSDLIDASDRIIEEEKSLASAKDHTVSGTRTEVSSDAQRTLKDYIQENVRMSGVQNQD